MQTFEAFKGEMGFHNWLQEQCSSGCAHQQCTARGTPPTAVAPAQTCSPVQRKAVGTAALLSAPQEGAMLRPSLFCSWWEGVAGPNHSEEEGPLLVLRGGGGRRQSFNPYSAAFRPGSVDVAASASYHSSSAVWLSSCRSFLSHDMAQQVGGVGSAWSDVHQPCRATGCQKQREWAYGAPVEDLGRRTCHLASAQFSLLNPTQHGPSRNPPRHTSVPAAWEARSGWC